MDGSRCAVKQRGREGGDALLYHDIVDAAREGLSEEKMGAAIEMNGYYDCMERPSVSEIMQWVKDGAIDVDGVPAFEEHEESDDGFDN